MPDPRPLTAEETTTLTAGGTTAQDWSAVTVTTGFDASRVRNTTLLGRVTIGAECDIKNAVLADTTVGDGCRIVNVGVHIANYTIGDAACIENVGTLATTPGATFGNGVEVEVLNEGGGREVVLFNELSAQFAYLMCLHRWRPTLIEKLTQLAAKCVDAARADRGTIGAGAVIRSTTELTDVCVGPQASINGAGSLRNGTVLSAADAPTTIGMGVMAEDFIIAEGASVTGGAILGKTFVGQGCQVGKQFSAENTLFFANCEAFHGEACSVFAGPYTVTHHKSTLLIAGLFSFYNAGSGTNQSNHMYKLGPVHEGKLGRGTKTGSFSYMMWPCRVGPFSNVMGKNTGTFDTADYPFSHLEATPDGKTAMIPGLNVVTVGTVRDGAKWPTRDRRTGAVKRDTISFDVFSPYLVGLMRRARAELKRLYEAADKSTQEVSVGGALVRRPILRTGQKYYRNGIETYLYEKVFERAESALARGNKNAFATEPGAVADEDWLDIGGQLMPRQRLADLQDAIEAGTVADIPGFFAAVGEIRDGYGNDEWAWVKKAFSEETGTDLDTASTETLTAIADAYLKVKGKFFRLILADAQKEFDAATRSGFGQDGGLEDVDKDFAGVRGSYEGNKFVKEMQGQLRALEERVTAFKARVAGQ